MDKRSEKQKEALAAIRANNYTGIILMSVRSGKTKIGIDTIKSLKPNNVLWITPETKLRDEAIPAEFIKFKAKGFLGKTDIVCYSSLHKVTGCYEYVIADEYQHFTENNVVNLLNGTLRYKHLLAMSGTHPKEYLKRQICSDLNLNIIYTLSTDDAADDEIVADYRMNIVPFFLDNTRKYIESKRSKKLMTEKARYESLSWVIENKKISGGDPSYLIISRMHLLYNSIIRQQKIKDLLLSTCFDKRGLIFHPNKKSAETYQYYFHSTSKSKHFEDFQQNLIKQLHLVNKGGVGYTYRDLDFCIISQANSDKTGLNTQKWGRTLLPRPGYVSDIYMLCCMDTVDEKWVKSSLENIEQSKINWLWST